MDWVIVFVEQLWQVLLDLSPALLAGLLLAGALHVFVPAQLVRTHLSGRGLGSVLRATLIGVPMPLCSCGVIPAGLGLRNQGASRGATTAFLISTPQTGVDSVLVSAAFLGWPFALFKVAAAFVTGIAGGWLVNRFGGETDADDASTQSAETAVAPRGRLAELLRYALFDILAAIDLWLLVGILLAAAIGTALPPDALRDIAWTQGLGGMLLVLAVSLPLYVCTTGSVPIAASLIAAGMPAGTALVFLMAGPATNVATIGAVYRVLGPRVLALYLGTVVVFSVGLGLGFDFVLGDLATPDTAHAHGAAWWQSASAVLLLVLIAVVRWRAWRDARRTAAPVDEDALTLKVQGMTCQHCVANVCHALRADSAVDAVSADLHSGLVRVSGSGLQRERLAAAVVRAGYVVEDVTGDG